jgi:hypothetical protein
MYACKGSTDAPRPEGHLRGEWRPRNSVMGCRETRLTMRRKAEAAVKAGNFEASADKSMSEEVQSYHRKRATVRTKSDFVTTPRSESVSSTTGRQLIPFLSMIWEASAKVASGLIIKRLVVIRSEARGTR